MIWILAGFEVQFERRRLQNKTYYRLGRSICPGSFKSRDWPYFINRLLELSKGDITSLNLSGVDNKQNNFDDIKIINDAIDNLTICKGDYSNI